MSPFHLDSTGLMVWGLVAHLIADWPLQNDWMARGKAGAWWRELSVLGVWRTAAPGVVHAGIHMVALGLVFGYWLGVALGAVHYLIDLRKPVAWWSRLIRQTQPTGEQAVTWHEPKPLAVVDIGTEVRFWTDQVFHIACIAVAALLVGGLS